MTKKLNLYGTVSVAALLLSIGAASAQDWSPTALNNDPVTVGGVLVDEANEITNIGSLTGAGSSASISGVGASASVTTTTITPVAPPGTVLNFSDTGFPDVSTTATNNGDITNEGNLIQFNDGQQMEGAASTVSLGATGAAASVGWTGIGTPGLEVKGSGTITQEATNTGTVTLQDGEIATDGTDLFTLTGPASAAAASATGASASVAVRAIGSDDFGMAADASIGNINQTVSNEWSSSHSVVASRNEIASGVLQGTASSVTVAGSGAAASVGISAVDADSFGGVEVGTVSQDVTSTSVVRNTRSRVEVGDLVGSGTLASVSGIGASASVSESFVESAVAGGSIIGNVNQTSTGGRAAVRVDGTVLQTGEISGNSASARIAATGAAATVSSSATESEVVQATQFGTVTQEVTTSDLNVNLRSAPARAVTAEELSGDGASASIGATAAAASVSVSLVDTTAASALPSFRAIDQEATSSADITAGRNQVTAQDLTGTAAGAQVALTGATTSVSVSLVNAQRLADGGASFDTITSSAERTGSADFVVGEDGAATPNTVTTGDLIGNAASASVSATGASASVSETMLSVAPEPLSARNTSGRIETTALNESDILHANSAVTTGALEGAATSARIGTTGAAASFSSTAVDGAGRAMEVDGGLAQSATNQGDLTTRDASVTVGTVSDPVDVSGNAASAGISTVGASMSVGATKVDAALQGSRLIVNGGIAQSGSNEGAVALSDSGVIVGNLSGAAASASAGATGLSASVSVSNIGSAGASEARQFGLSTSSIWQGDATNPLSNSGEVSVNEVSVSSGAISGPAASAGISARGASGSVSLSSIATTGAGVGPAGNGAESILGGINQYITNDAGGAVSISDSNIAAGGISGAGASASISAVGASAGVSVSTIVADSVVQASFTGPITQSAVNDAPVTVTGNSVNVGGDISGNGSSAGISAVGASASISFSTIN